MIFTLRKIFRGAIGAAFCAAALASPCFGAGETKVSTSLLYDDGLVSALAFSARRPHFDVFLGAETAWALAPWDSPLSGVTGRGEGAGTLRFGEISLTGGNITKPSALSRLENPAPASYTSAAGGISVPATGVKSSLPSSVGNHAGGASLFGRLPLTRGPVRGGAIGAEIYANKDDTLGGRVTLSADGNALAPWLFRGKKAALQFTAGGFAYRLAPKEETSWTLSTPYFAPGVFSSYLAEGAARVTFFPKTTPALFYAALGLAESPFGYLTPWVRAEAAFPVPLGASRLTLKGKVYYAAREFYTPKNTFSPARFKAMGNAVAAIPLGSALSMTAGLSLSWDDASRQGQARAALSFAALGFSAGVNGFFNAWKIPETGGLVTESDTTAGGGLTLGAALPSAKLGFTGTCKVYPGAKTPKTEYSAAFTAAPREKKVKKGEKPPPQFIPDCRLRFDGATKAGVFSGEITAAASWDFLAKGISVAIKLEAVAPLAD